MHRMSPLRYPGGKGKMYDYIKKIILNNNLLHCTYVEPFAGGAEVALRLLNDGIVDNIIINDFDKAIYSFWYSALNNTDELISLIRDTNISMEEREKQIKIYNNPNSSCLELGFATFYLNRVNRSGIIKGGPISRSLDSKYPLDCRFNKDELISRFEKLKFLSSKIDLKNLDAGVLIEEIGQKKESNLFFFIDPPYYYKAKSLYMNFFKYDDHAKLKEKIAELPETAYYIVTYDNVKEIVEIYNDYDKIEYQLSYTVGQKKKGNEVMFYSPNLVISS